MRNLVMLALLSCGASGSPATAPASQAPDGFWEHWGDGKAELAAYDLVQPRYGELRKGKAVLVFVTEDFTRKTRVKTDGGHKDAFPVIKLNEVRDFPTGIYDYNAMTSSFLPLDGSLSAGLPTKVSLSVQEWCGQVYEQWVVDPGEARVDRHSYFDGEADRRSVVQIPSGAVFGDAWPILVRGLVGERVAPGQTAEVPWLPTLMSSRFAHSDAVFGTATVTRSTSAGPVTVPMGTFDAWTWSVVHDGRSTTWWVEQAAPYRLLGWEADDGEKAVLTHLVREPYWKQNDVSDESRRGRLGL